MNKVLPIIGVSFIAVSLISVGLLAVALTNYLDVTEARLVIPENISISEVRIPPIEDESQDVTVQVLFNISNPSKLTAIITNIEYFFYMDNKSDPRTLPEKLEEILVSFGIYDSTREQGYRVRPGSSVTIPVNMTVSGGTRFVSILNTTFEGRYYPYINSVVRYTFKNIDTIEIVGGVGFIGAVDPYTS